MTTRPEMWGSQGVASSTHWLASAAGAAMYEHGGNAFDAAVAAGLVLQVVEPHLNGLGGDVSILVHDGNTGATRALCGQGPMPASASIEAFQGHGLDYVPGSGLLAATVPGAFGAWMRLLDEYGTLPARAVIEPAIHYATVGAPLLPKAAEMIAAVQPVFSEHWRESAHVYLDRDGRAPRAGQRWCNPDLAATYRRLLSEGEAAGGSREAVIRAASDAYYRGFVAETIDGYVSHHEVLDATGSAHAGFLTGHDLSRWSAEEETVSLEFRGQVVHKAGPWTQGPIFLQQLALLGDIEDVGFLGAEHLHLVTEAAKLALADREAWYADPHFAEDVTARLLDPAYNARRRALIGDTASRELRPGVVDGRAPRLPDLALMELDATDPPWLVQLQEGVPVTVPMAMLATQTSGDTCFVSAADGRGNLVAATPSGGWLKSSPVLPGLGFPLGTRGQMAWLDDAHPNALAGRKRPRTTLSPTIVEHAGGGGLAFGTPGGDQQDQWTLQAFLAHTVFGLGLQESVEAPAFHTEHAPTSFAPRRAAPGTITVEEGVGERTIAGLEARGHDVRVVPDRSLGKVCFSATDGDACRAAASPNGSQAYAVAR